MDAITYHASGGTTLTGSAIDIMGAATIRVALRMHVNSGGRMRMSRAASPTVLMASAAKITGQKFKTRDYAGAIVALDQWITEAKCKVLHITKE